MLNKNQAHGAIKNLEGKVQMSAGNAKEMAKDAVAPAYQPHTVLKSAA